MIYETKIQDVRIGTHHLRLECLRDFEATIDLLFAKLEREGREELLTELCPYFGRLWPSALALARHLAVLPAADLADRAVLELGCDLAVPGLVAARRGAHVTVTDNHPEVPRFLARNLELNALADRVAYQALDWRLSTFGLDGYDWIVGSDVLYERDHPQLLATLLRRIARPGARIVIADPGRAWLQDFVTALEGAGFAPTFDAVASATDAAADQVFLVAATSPG